MTKKKSIPDKVLKYAQARASGIDKDKSKDIAGYSVNTSAHDVENLETYKVVTIRDALLGQISIKDITAKHIENIVQDTDKNARNNAIKLAYDRIEPSNAIMEDTEKITITLK